MYVDIGRTDVYCFTLNGGTAVYVYNIYAWHGSQKNEEERQKGEDMFEDILIDAEYRTKAGAAVIIAGDGNADVSRYNTL